jgi:hypothetical protein
MALNRALQDVTAALVPSAPGPPTEATLGQAWADLVSPLNSNPRLEFAEGLTEGAAEGLAEWAIEQVSAGNSLLMTVIEMREVTHDPMAIAVLLEGWIEGRGAQPLVDYVSSAYPALATALQASVHLSERAADFAARIANHPAGALPALGAWFETLPQTIGNALRSTIDELIAADGNPHRQGEIIGRVAAPAAVQIAGAALTVVDVAEIGMSLLASRVAKGALLVEEIEVSVAEARAFALEVERGRHIAAELEAAADLATKTAPAATREAIAAADAARRALTEDWGRFRVHIAPHRITKGLTSRWGKAVRELTGFSTKNPEYAIALRLDSGHIIEANLMGQFPQDMKLIFTDWEVLDADGQPFLQNGKALRLPWTSADDMDTMGVHTEAHIRGGKQMAENFGLVGAEKYRPLHFEMQDFFASVEQELGRPFQDAAEAIAAHKVYYERLQPKTWSRLEKWFERAKAAIQRAAHTRTGLAESHERAELAATRAAERVVRRPSGR